MGWLARWLRRTFTKMTPRRITRQAAKILATALAGGGVLISVAEARLRMVVGRADNGQIYQVLQYRAGDDLGVGAEELQITSVVASSSQAETCGTGLGISVQRDPAESLAYGPIQGSRPLELAYRSRLIADASAPCFDAAAVDGLGRVCVGPGCSAACECTDEDRCFAFSMTDGTTLDIASPDVPAAKVVAPVRARHRQCNVLTGVAYGFGSAGSITTESDLCATAPADGFRLAGSPTSLSGGVDGTTLIIVYDATQDELVTVAAAGFGIDRDGSSAYQCGSPGGVVAAVQADGEEAPIVPPPGPPVSLSTEELKCQRSIARSGRKFSMRVLKALQVCRERILKGAWPITSQECQTQPYVERSIRSAARVSRATMSAKCRAIDMSRLLTCGDSIDDLISSDNRGGCLFSTHLQAAEDMAEVEFGF